MAKLKRDSGSSKQRDREFRKAGMSALQRLQNLNKARVLEQMKTMDPIVFEYLVAAVMERRGYKTRMTASSGDGGVDVLARRGFKRSVVQCKRYDGSVGEPVVRDLYGTMIHNKAKEAFLVTTATVTRQAVDWSRDKPIRLVDGFKLAEWIVESRATLRNRRIFTFVVAFLLMLGLFNAYLYLPFSLIQPYISAVWPSFDGQEFTQPSFPDFGNLPANSTLNITPSISTPTAGGGISSNPESTPASALPLPVPIDDSGSLYFFPFIINNGK